MKKNIYLLFSLLILGFWGCERKEEYPEDNYHPRIFGTAFNVRDRMVNEGESIVFSGLTFSPSPNGRTAITWKVNDEVVSTDTTFTFDSAHFGGGIFEIKLEATFNGQTATRISNVIVSPLTYTPKPYTHVVLGYVSAGGTSSDVDWENVTHVAFNGARVIPDGTVDFSAGNINQVADALVGRGHINGVPVLLGVSGRLSGVDGWSIYGSNDFGSVISNPTLRASLVSTLVEYVTTRRMDGIDILMTDISNDYAAASMAAVGPFINELKAALPTGALVTATVTVNWMHWEYSNLSAADWLHVRAFENGLHVGLGVPLGQQSPLSFMVDGADLWLNTKGYPADKLVIGIPAFGQRYLELDADGNNLGWSSYDYLRYRDIVALDPAAPQNEYSGNTAHGVYYNGIPLVQQKADHILANGFKGAYLWAADYDAGGENSLLQVLSNTLQ